MRVRFTADFDYHPTEQSTVGYLAGMEMTVKRECAEQAIAAGKAVEIVGEAAVAGQDVTTDKIDGDGALGG